MKVSTQTDNRSRLRGVNYDVGIDFDRGYVSRPDFDRQIARRELKIIRDDLHCNAVRVSGTDVGRLLTAAELALEEGLDVWMSPHLHDRGPQQTTDYLTECAARAERLRQTVGRDGPELVFVAGCELTWFMNGILPGKTSLRRLGNPLLVPRLKLLKSHNGPLNAFLTQAGRAVREVFDGRVTYASAPIEDVDWSLFDIVSLDYYRARKNRDTYGKSLAPRFAHHKPVVITEVGLCPYRGAQDKGPRGHAIIDHSAGPWRLNGDYIRDEAMQARELTDMLQTLDETGVDGTFVFTFVTPALPHNPAPRRDLDLAGYALVTTYPDRNGDTYPDMPWEPKQAFTAVATHYAGKDS
jgi:hypothetical protein